MADSLITTVSEPRLLSHRAQGYIPLTKGRMSPPRTGRHTTSRPSTADETVRSPVYDGLSWPTHLEEDNVSVISNQSNTTSGQNTPATHDGGQQNGFSSSRTNTALSSRTEMMLSRGSRGSAALADTPDTLSQRPLHGPASGGFKAGLRWENVPYKAVTSSLHSAHSSGSGGSHSRSPSPTGRNLEPVLRQSIEAIGGLQAEAKSLSLSLSLL